MNPQRTRSTDRGIALMAVIVVLLALVAIATPFALSMRNHDRTSAVASYSVKAEQDTRSVLAYGEERLASIAGANDANPHVDGDEELTVELDSKKLGVDLGDPNGTVASVSVEDEQGKVNVNACSPFLLANLLGESAALTVDLKADDSSEVKVDDATAFPEQGAIWIDGELILYREKTHSSFTGLTRGFDTTVMKSSKRSVHPAGASVLDYRVVLATARSFKAAEHEWTAYASVRELKDIARFGEVSFTADEIDAVEPFLTAHSVIDAPGRFVGACRSIFAVGPDDEVPLVIVTGSRNFAAGTVVRVHDEKREEYGIVVKAEETDEGRVGIELQEKLENSFKADQALVESLARAAVNVNACHRRVLIALVEGLRLTGSTERIGKMQAERFADAVIHARPVAGFEALTGIVNQLTTAGALTERQREALLRNAENPLDTNVLGSTAPFCFASRDVVTLESAVSENQQAGREASRLFAREVLEVRPPGRQLSLLRSQLDFEEQMRLTREGRRWTTLPVNEQSFDRENEPPSRYVSWTEFARFANDTVSDEQGKEPAARLAPVRIDGRRDATATRGDRVIHFDERRTLAKYNGESVDGWDLEKQSPLSLEPDGELVDLLNDREWMQPFAVSFWWIPGKGKGEHYLFDCGESEISNRLFAYHDGKGLVFRVADATVPDAPGGAPQVKGGAPAAESPTQMAEIRYDFDDGLQFETGMPYHVTCYARGTKPSDLVMLIDGVPRGRRAFQTRLTQSLDQPPQQNGPFSNVQGYTGGKNSTLNVDDARGFPSYGVVRVGNELMEVVKTGDKTLSVQPVQGGGFGGRARRGSKGSAHRAGEAVELYGYAGILQSDVIANGTATLGGPLGEFTVAMVDPSSPDTKKPIAISEPFPAQIGYGIDETVVKIPLVPLAKPKPGASSGAGGAAALKDAFQRGGGFALVISSPQPPPSDGGDFRQKGPNGTELLIGWDRALHTDKGAIIGLGELIHYQSFDGSTLNGVTRAPGSVKSYQWQPFSNLGKATTNSKDIDKSGIVAHAHVSRWFLQQDANNHDPDQPIFVIPISVSVGGLTTDLGSKFTIPSPSDDGGGKNKVKAPATGGNNNQNSLLTSGTRPEIVQVGIGFNAASVTSASNANGGTEWVRYDTIAAGAFVRDNPERLRQAIYVLGQKLTEKYTKKTGTLPNADAVARAVDFEMLDETQQDAAKIASDAMIEPAYLNSGVLQFRGVLTSGRKGHPAGESILPVWRTYRRWDVQSARPGPRDFVTLVSAAPKASEEHRVNFSYCGNDAEYWGGSCCHIGLEAAVTGTFKNNFQQMVSNVDIQNQSETAAENALANQNIDSRDLTRVLKFPSGELPTAIGQEFFVGGDLRGEKSPAGGTFDELEFFTPTTPSVNLPNYSRYILNRDDGLDGKLYLSANRLRYNDWMHGGPVIEAVSPVTTLPKDGFVLLIDDELICIEEVMGITPDEAELKIAPNGRGWLGTPIQFHPANTSVRDLCFLRVSRVEKDLSTDAREIVLADPSDFDRHGVVALGRELLGYSWIERSSLFMPPWRDPDQGDKEVGLLRARFGTHPESHEQGTLAYQFPVRFEDRYRPRADDPELSYFGTSVKGKGAFWNELSWIADGTTAQADVVVQAVVNGRAAFDADPKTSTDLFVFEKPGSPDAPNRILRQGDDVRIRVFTRYKDGAFDTQVFEPDPGPTRGGSNEWKRSPRLRALGIEWIAGPPRRTYEEWR